ncbi:MAG: cell division protein FtsZ [Bacteroidetes bacterium]|nr:cell division protein FtsZ [Bacteroidota bacterium]
MLKFDLPKNQSSIIKVIGVGGGGSNAVTHMYRQGIKGVDFIICNTDIQAMESSPVPTKIALGENLTGGLGAGAVPSVGKNAALENIQELRTILEKGTKMLFITAGMGGGTGTGAAPVIASVSKELGILTVGIITMPFSFEGRKRKQHAEQGIAELKKHVDAVLIINNDKLRELFGDQRLSAAFGHADDVLTTAAKGIAEIITVTGYINVDFEDVKTVMKESGVAIMGSGIANGPDRAINAIEMALSSPLLNDNNIEGANNLLLYITSGKEEITMDEVTEITDYIQEKTKNSAEVIWGNGTDESLDDNINVTIIATGFDEEHKRKPAPQEKAFVVTPLYDQPGQKAPVPLETPVMIKPEPEAPVTQPEPEISVNYEMLEEIRIVSPLPEPEPEPEPMTPVFEKEPVMDEPAPQRTIVFDLGHQEPEPRKIYHEEPTEESAYKREVEVPVSEVLSRPSFKPVEKTVEEAKKEHPEMEKMMNDRVQKLRALSEKLKTHPPLETHLAEIESVPAYKRRNVELADVQPSSESQIELYTVTDKDKNVEIKKENSFLHNNVD